MGLLSSKLSQYTLPWLLILSAFTVFSQEQQASEKINAIPYGIKIDEQGSNITVLPDKIIMVANKGTDLFTNTTGEKSADKSPRILFEPSGDFIF
ncbi:hypothetical protein AADZ84_12330 [Colwelliaceae bacterium MEBiC 14330]